MSAPESWKTLGSIPARTTSSWLVVLDPDGRDLQHRAGDLQAGRRLEAWPERLDVQRHAAPDGVAAGQDRGDPALGTAARRLRHRAERHDGSQRDHHRPHGQTGPHPIPGQVRAPEEPLRAEDPLERTADDPAERLEDEGGRDRAADEEPKGQDEREERRAGAPDREEQDAGDHDDQLGDDERAQPVAQPHHGVGRGAQGGDR